MYNLNAQQLIRLKDFKSKSDVLPTSSVNGMMWASQDSGKGYQEPSYPSGTLRERGTPIVSLYGVL
jgi:hypothetical protein